MKLLELYEDLFQYVCRLNRAARTTSQPEFAAVRSEVRTLLEETCKKASSDVRLLSQFKRLELPMIFYVDNVVCTSRLKFASQWASNRLATERNELAGDERFFDFLDDDLKDTSEEAAERLAVYYVCLGLGFRGMYHGQPDQLRGYMDKIFPRVRQWIDSDPRSRISDDAYKHTNTTVLPQPPNNKIVLVAIVFVFLSLSVLAINYGLYVNASSKITGSVETIFKKLESPGRP